MIGIIGGGPAGLSLAKLLSENGVDNTVVFEAENRIGGKSFSFKAGAKIAEMGTSYASSSHVETNRWMQQMGISMSKLGDQKIDNEHFLKFVNVAPGPNIISQSIKYLRARGSLMKRLSAPNPTQETLQEAAQPVIYWLRSLNLPKIERLMYRGITGIGYGDLDRISTYQAIVWMDPGLFKTILTKNLKMPDTGWHDFWVRLSSDLDVRKSDKVVSVKRGPDGVEVTSSSGVYNFDQVVCAIPLDDFVPLTDASEEEISLANSVEWNQYSSAVVVVNNWFTDLHIQAYSKPMLPGAAPGQILASRYEGHEPDLGGHVYSVAQMSGDYSASELKEIILNDIKKHGGEPVSILQHRMWKYHAMYKNKAVEEGLLGKLVDIQGQNRTFYTGATFSYEAVSSITGFNNELAKKIVRQLAA